TRGRRLWGNRSLSLRRARSPRWVAEVLHRAGLPHPRIRMFPGPDCPPGRWLLKPLASCGGTHNRPGEGGQLSHEARKRTFCQEFIPGESCSAIYVGDGRQAGFMGATLQIVGAEWLHAPPFHYCGSIGPLTLSASCTQQFQLLGDVLAE